MFNEDEILSYANYGESDKWWYKKTTSTLVELFGRSNLWLVCQLLASTSMNSTLKSNITLFIKAYKQIKSGAEIKGFVPVMQMQIERIRKGEAIRGRKITNFANAMYGDENAVVVDMWILIAFRKDKYRKFRGRDKIQSARGKDYDIIEDWIKTTALRLHLEPRQLCSMIWSGIRKLKTGKDNPSQYCDILRNKIISPLFNINHLTDE